jgi:hypothetical protein
MKLFSFPPSYTGSSSGGGAARRNASSLSFGANGLGTASPAAPPPQLMSRLGAALSPAPAYPCAALCPVPARTRTLTLASNSDWMAPSLLELVERADLLMQRGAYLHWYARFGVDKDTLQSAAESMLAVADAYADARKI